MPKQDEQAAEADEAEIVLQVPVVAHEDAAVVLQPGIEALDLPAPPIAPQRTAILRGGPAPIGPMRRDHGDAPCGESGIQRTGVIRLVADQTRRERPGEALREGGL